MEIPHVPVVPLSFEKISPEVGLARGRAFAAAMQSRRSVRYFSYEAVSREAV